MIKGNKKSNKKLLVNVGFAVLCAALLAFLLAAPEESTTRLPHDDIHRPFHLIKSKKEAGSRCAVCHSETGEAPLPEDHPPPYRCLFCHKRDS